MTSVPGITLNNGVEIPQLGFGTFQIPPADARQATLTALEIGYRHIDTAQMYGNEKEVGQAVRDSGLDRDDIFVTSKLNNPFHAPDAAHAAFDQSLADLGLSHLDLFLIHWPLPGVGDFVETWKALEEIYRSGRARAIGVSNFQPNHLRRLLAGSVVVPAVNQIEVHPYLTQDAVGRSTPSRASPPSPGPPSPRAGCWTTRPSPVSRTTPAGLPRRSRSAGTSSGATSSSRSR